MSEMKRIRRSVPTAGVHQWWMSGWMYIMPDFDNPNHSIVEWYSDKPPVFAVEASVSETTNTEDAHGDDRRQQPA